MCWYDNNSKVHELLQLFNIGDRVEFVGHYNGSFYNWSYRGVIIEVNVRMVEDDMRRYTTNYNFPVNDNPS